MARVVAHPDQLFVIAVWIAIIRHSTPPESTYPISPDVPLRVWNKVRRNPSLTKVAEFARDPSNFDPAAQSRSEFSGRPALSSGIVAMWPMV
ncbi:hypothetical protein EIP91_011461 [Steccherinum ochraceum]|uniref:Uncharacterized protein n=1 Tax=Steccherinum ochraceum TaxID=92696 RepID=A0A4R0RMD2_9APHY|nr:hypothetical protein EIP91_011461 [Steccherinum ochraceum]